MTAAPPPPHPTPDPVLVRAARLRAAGLSWDAVAGELRADPAALEARAADAGPAYRQLYKAARRDVGEEAFAEALFALRRGLRSKDEKARTQAADCILKLRMTHIRHRRRNPTAADAPPPLTSETE